MKRWFAVSLLLAAFGLIVPASASPRIVTATKTPNLRASNIHFDAARENLHGTVYLLRGAGTPRLPHVHIYAYGANGNLLFSGCAVLDDQALRLQPRVNLAPHDTFSFSFPPAHPPVTEVRIVADSEDHCADHVEVL